MKPLQLSFIFFLISFTFALAQQKERILVGKILDAEQNPVNNVNIVIEGTGFGTISDADGVYKLEIPDDTLDGNIIFSHIQFKEIKIPISSIDFNDEIFVTQLDESMRVLDQVNITEDKLTNKNENASTFNLSPVELKFMPSPFQDISSILITLPGVSSNNELSTGYSVRGGNYDENLVYVNNIPVYRPQIITSGQQEGLSFINTDLVRGIEFSSGGWEAKYGDGLASTLNIDYKKPSRTGGSLSIGLLGGSAHIEGSSKNDRFTYLVGARHKSSVYLLNTLETKGEYRPKFTDIQTYLNYDISKKGKKNETEIGVLFSYARNRYLVRPTSRETTFGTFNNQLRLFVAFDGQEKLTYDTWQGGIRLSHRMTSQWKTHLIVSGTYSREREYYDVEAGYLLCNVDNDPGSGSFNECMSNIGIGTNYYSGRNLLNVRLLNVESRNELIINDKNSMEFGIGYANHDFDDLLNEYEFIDSADYVRITDAVTSENNINYNRIHAYWQNTSYISANQFITYGFRMLYQDFNKQLLISPRVQYSIKPAWAKNTFFRASVGLYKQAPFYREFRNNQGEINEDLKAQSSVHTIIGLDHSFTKWGRPFKFITEIYYKYMWDVNPYDIENVRIRYFADNIAKAYATGIDFRVSGEFIPGDESWFSLGILSTKENLETDNRGYIPRPSDQRVNLGIFFQDHIPNAPTFKVHLRLLYSTGLPFSPPVNPANRNSFRGSEYQRLDIGFSKMIKFGIEKENPFLKSLWITAEILNLTGNQNTISYYWVQDVNSNYYGVPNSLSQRFFNVRMNLNF